MGHVRTKPQPARVRLTPGAEQDKGAEGGGAAAGADTSGWVAAGAATSRGGGPAAVRAKQASFGGAMAAIARHPLGAHALAPRAGDQYQDRAVQGRSSAQLPATVKVPDP